MLALADGVVAPIDCAFDVAGQYVAPVRAAHFAGRPPMASSTV